MRQPKAPLVEATWRTTSLCRDTSTGEAEFRLGLGFRVQGSGFRVQGLGFRV